MSEVDIRLPKLAHFNQSSYLGKEWTVSTRRHKCNMSFNGFCLLWLLCLLIIMIILAAFSPIWLKMAGISIVNNLKASMFANQIMWRWQPVIPRIQSWSYKHHFTWKRKYHTCRFTNLCGTSILHSNYSSLDITSTSHWWTLRGGSRIFHRRGCTSKEWHHWPVR